ncbi:MAG TPA: long-chain fatty acid--CoA ligase [Polyangiaceae bacterium]|jgi:fatty-acyl-CoA synthase|nr:long-chain fatty acid--CoA ligase [Polyangiaceae bacterium]
MTAGRMMDFPLTLTHLLDRARRYFPSTEIVSRGPDGKLHRQTWSDTYDRSCKLAHALARLGVKAGDRVATLAWNHHRHLEAYYAVPMMGAVVHTLNLRLHPTEIGYIARHAGDSVVLVDRSLLPLFNQFIESVPSIRHVIVMADDGPTPEGKLDYERLLAAEPAQYDWPRLEENTAATICYTSGTTGNPKGVVYSHRSNVLHALVGCLPDQTNLSQRDVVLPVVPMFHANCWGFAHMAAAVGASLVFPGPKLDPESLLDLMAEAKVTVAAGVPTIWIGILALLDAHPKKWELSRLRQMMVGGSAAPPAMIDGFARRHGLNVVHAWGMTETNPVGSVARVKRTLETTSEEAQLGYRASQGYAVPFFEMRHSDDQGRVLPWDGETMGELEVRGPWVAASYVGDEGKDRWTSDGWFKTGDVVTLDAEGYVRICDRSKDVIKSGGEWISSVALENALMSHPCVLEAAVFAGRHPKWDERPIAAIVLKKDQQVTGPELGKHIEGQFAKFWMPDAYVFVEQIPRTSTGKFLKTRLRDTYGSMLVDDASKKDK